MFKFRTLSLMQTVALMSSLVFLALLANAFVQTFIVPDMLDKQQDIDQVDVWGEMEHRRIVENLEREKRGLPPIPRGPEDDLLPNQITPPATPKPASGR